MQFLDGPMMKLLKLVLLNNLKLMWILFWAQDKLFFKKKVPSYISVTKKKKSHDLQQKYFIELFAESNNPFWKYIAKEGMPINIWWGLESWPIDWNRNVD